jgi:hypothetical protein
MIFSSIELDKRVIFHDHRRKRKTIRLRNVVVVKEGLRRFEKLV